MNAARWGKMQDIFHQAVDLPADRQAAFLEAACGEDAALRKSVEAMLSEDVSLLDHGLAGVAESLLSDALPPENFGPYRALKLLGQGGMGVVYLAEREDLGTLVAIKVLRDAWLHPSRRERFDSERRVLAQLNHPCIARLYDAAALPDGTPWFVMEYVEGVPITEYCSRYKCTIDRKLQLFRTVCEAVQYAHEQAVIHRDLKPSNIFVKSDGAIRLLDFGIAKQADGMEQQVDQTRTVHRMMTPAYASPEQVHGRRISTQTDVYSLGVILFELLTGELPFDLSNLTPEEAASIVVTHDPPKPSAVARKNASGDLSSGRFRTEEWSELDVLCLTAMHKDPERRYRSVEALIRDIDCYRGGEPLEARPDSFRYRAHKFVRRNRRMVALTSAVALLLAGVLVYSTARITRARDAAIMEAARTARVQAFMMNLFEGGDKAAGPSDQMRVVDLVDKGVQDANALNGAPKVQAELYQTLGNINKKLGHLDQADSLLQRSLRQRRALFGQESPEVAESLVALSQLRDDQARFPEAEKLVREAIAIDAGVLAPNHPARARAMMQLGRVLEDRGACDRAIPVLERVVQMQSAPDGVEADLSASLTELANCYYDRGRYGISDKFNRRALNLDRKLYGERHPEVADDWINLGAIQLDEGHYDQAEKYDRQALDILQSFYGDDNVKTASAMTLLGRALVADGKYSEASDMLQRALVTEERVYGSIHPRIASTLNELGKIAQKQGKLKLAEADFERMADIYRKVYDGRHYSIGVAFSNLAGVYADEKQYQQAENLLREALQLYSEVLPPDHLNIGIAKIRLGRVLLEQHDYLQAQAETQAGYDIVQKQEGPPSNWMQAARQDLAEEYTKLGHPQQAGIFQTSESVIPK